MAAGQTVVIAPGRPTPGKAAGRGKGSEVTPPSVESLRMSTRSWRRWTGEMMPPGTVLGLYIISPTLRTVPQRGSYGPHLTDKETEVHPS